MAMTTGQRQGEEILLARRRAGMTQRELAELLGLPEAVVIAAEKGRLRRGLSQEEFQRWMDALSAAPARRQ
jgi:transcriptional regulator with XRE-family HTH domain